MRVIIHMIITANGMITGKDGATSFISKKASAEFLRMMGEVRANLVGSGTYKETLVHGSFPYPGLNVVMTRKKVKSRWKNVIFTDKGPREALYIFKKHGINTVMVGGGKINSAFMKENLVDELYLSIEPAVLTEGIKLFDGADFKAKLRLLGVRRLSNGVVQLHYKVVKQNRSKA